MPARGQRGKAKKRWKKPGWEVPVEPGDLPDSYGETRVVLLPVDPYLLHAYWDVVPGELEKAKSQLGENDQRVQAILRFYEIPSPLLDSSHPRSTFDVEIELQARNWYVPLWSPGKSYFVDLGLRTEDGRFLRLARSNGAETPRAWPRERGGERYMLIEGDYERVEIVPEEVGVRPPGLSSPKAPEVEAGPPSPSPFPEGRGGGIDAAGILGRKPIELYVLREGGKPPSAPPEEEGYVDLTELGERRFTVGVSSLER